MEKILKKLVWLVTFPWEVHTHIVGVLNFFPSITFSLSLFLKVYLLIF